MKGAKSVQLTKEEALQLVRTLQPHVSGFSQSFQMNGKSKDIVSCGGKVKYVVDPSNWSDVPEDIIFVTLDDGVGELLIVVPTELWTEADTKVGDTLIAKGVLFKPLKEGTFLSKAGTDIKVTRTDEPFRVLVMSVHMLET